jgi:hypothetical protein
MRGINVVADASEYFNEHPLPPGLLRALTGLDYLIYGGFVRDLIAKHHNPSFQSGFVDIDIILLWRSHGDLLKRLLSQGEYTLGLDEHAAKVYRHWGAVSHVYTLIPKAKGSIRIQLAAPNPVQFGANKDALQNALFEPVRAVDIRCCGVAITPNMKIIETLHGAFKDSQEMKLIESPLAAHKQNLQERIQKFSARGWIDQTNGN